MTRLMCIENDAKLQFMFYCVSKRHAIRSLLWLLQFLGKLHARIESLEVAEKYIPIPLLGTEVYDEVIIYVAPNDDGARCLRFALSPS